MQIDMEMAAKAYAELSEQENKKREWSKPQITDLGDAKDIIKGFAPADPKVAGGGDSDLAVASDL